MSTVLFKRGDMATMNATPTTDGMVFFNEENNRIYMDNGNTRYQYGGDTELISNPSSATASNAFNANASLSLFAQKTTVVDDKNTALNVTQDYIPLGCKAFKEAVGLTNYGNVGDGTISGGLVALKTVSDRHNNQLTANNNSIYMDYKNGKYGINTSANRGADTFIPFKGYEYLGTNTTYNLSNRSDYPNLTNSNFVVVITSIYEQGYTENWSSEDRKGSFSGSVSRPSPSYNASTGILQIINTSVSGATGKNLTSNTLSFGIEVFLFY